MTMYLNEPDHSGHEAGPDSEEVSAHSAQGILMFGI